ncbi:MAG TPA: glycoside hydrolase family 99-like domain-containing protein, partial [Caulobacterales bacterium]|nr:glycoside hydrolase family 99-like domain-containing protein [Caulobacterales bacterium]
MADAGSNTKRTRRSNPSPKPTKTEPVTPRRAELLFVAGMHRSGTSALTRTLSLCGLDLPRTPVGPRADNPDGFWESGAVIACNTKILADRGSNWDDVWASHPSRISRFSRGEIDAAKAALQSEFSFDRPAVLKDPRFSILFPVWRAAAEELDLDARLAIAVRNPLEVADSLLKRDEFSPLKSALLWLSHLVALERDSRGMARVFVGYDDLLRDWRRTIARIERLLDFRMPLRTTAHDLDIDKFLSRDKRHHDHSVEELAAREDLPAWIAKAYDWARLATSADAEPDVAALESVARAFYATGDICAPLMALDAGAAPSVAPEADPNKFLFALYSATPASPFSEETCVRTEITLGERPAWFQIATPNYGGGALTGLRLDPAESFGAFFLKDLTITDENGAVIWRWDGSDWFFNTGTGIVALPSTERGGVLLEFLSKDPQINLSHIEAIVGRPRVTVNVLAAAASPLDVERLRLINAREPDLGRRLVSSLAEFDARFDQRIAQATAGLTAHAERMNAGLAELDARLGREAESEAARLEALGQIIQNASAEQNASAAATTHALAERIEQQFALSAESARIDNQQAATAIVERVDAVAARQQENIEALQQRLAALEAQNEAWRAQLVQQQEQTEAWRAQLVQQQAQSAQEIQVAIQGAHQSALAQIDAGMQGAQGALQGVAQTLLEQIGGAIDGVRTMVARHDAILERELQAAAALQLGAVETLRSEIDQRMAAMQHQMRHQEGALADQLGRLAAENQNATEETRALLTGAVAALREAIGHALAEQQFSTQAAIEAALQQNLGPLAGDVDALRHAVAQALNEQQASLSAMMEATLHQRLAPLASGVDALREALAQTLSDQQAAVNAALEGVLQNRLENAAASEELRFAMARVMEAQQRDREALEHLRRAAAAAPEQMQSALAGVYVAIEQTRQTAASAPAQLQSALQSLYAAFDAARAEADRASAETMRAVETKLDTAFGRIDAVARKTDNEVRSAALGMEALEQKIERLGQEVAKQRDLGEVNEDLNRRLIETLRERDDARADVADLRRETRDLRSSTSWRLTAPIRALKEAPRRLGSAFGKGRREAHSAPRPLNQEALAGPSDEDVRGSDGKEAHATLAFLPATPDYVAIAADPLPVEPPARVIAFYLPQFHPIPENDAWWGEGFTEWSNVLKATPQFVGHYQPRVPDELGYYDLRNPRVQERQAELAKLYGVHGFCFYFYWFAGKRLLEAPMQAWLENKNIDLPYCLCWANENWSRRWDGLDAEILIAQDHSPEDDIAFIAHVSRYLRDPRYIRIDGKPLLIVYRPGLFPAAKETAERWRVWCRENGVGEIFLAYTQSFESVDPAEYGFDAAIEFPPNNSSPIDITDRIERINPDWSGTAYDYPTFVARSMNYVRRAYLYFRSVFPTWDNEARRKGRGTTYVGSTPALFRDWTRNAVRDAVLSHPKPDRRLVFCNAWNEWAEGAYLEPDRRYGYAWLQSVRDALIEVAADTQRSKLILVVHDGYLHGAQFLALNLAREIHGSLHRALEIVVLGDGPLKAEFERFGIVHDLAGVDPEGLEAQALAKRLFDGGARSAICNTTVSGLFLKTLARAGIRCVSLIHELPGVLQQYALERHVAAIREHAALTVFPAEPVRRAFPGGPSHASAIRPQGLYKRNGARTQEQRQAARERLRKHFGLAPNAHIILCVGYGDHRKGIDLFIDVGERVLAADPTAAMLWVGEIEKSLRTEIDTRVRRSCAPGRFLFPGFQHQTDDFYAGADIYALTSREDPFPTVVMESLDVGIPVVAFDGAGGFTELLRDGYGLLAPPFDADAFADRVLDLVRDPDRRFAMGAAGRQRVERDFSFRRYAFDVAAYADPTFKRISVVVPNYNYAGHMADRLGTIRHQSLPIYEVIVLDDCSSDDSVPVLKALLREFPIDHELIVNERNSGSACRQWLKGVERARGDFVWIAEADDLSDPDFLKETLAAFDDPAVVMSYCQSQQMSGDGQILCPHYLDYVADIDREKWRQAHVVEGIDEIRAVMGVKNTVPNVSACLFRRDALLGAMQDHIEEIARYRVAGDWATYVRVLERGKLAFSPNALNKHRRHERSVTIGSFNASLLREILSMQRHVRENYGLTPEAAQTARAYAQELYVQFGLNTPAAPRVGDNDEFALYLDA